MTDYTCNPNLKPPRIDFSIPDSTLPLAQLHMHNGGDASNPLITTRRILSVYVAQPILTQAFRELTGNHDRDAIRDPYKYKEVMLGRFIKLDLVSIRGRGEGGMYGLIEFNHAHDQASGDAHFITEDEDFSGPKRLTVLSGDPGECPELVALHAAKEKYLEELAPASSPSIID